MTPENFVYWLQGWFELNDTIDHREGATPETLEAIRNHLNLVLNKKTPDVIVGNNLIPNKTSSHIINKSDIAC